MMRQVELNTNKTGRSKHRDANLTQTQRPDRLHTWDIREDTER